MARPFKCRQVTAMPGVTYFKPAGIPLRILKEVRLSIEEAEAIRLKDVQEMEQEEAAKVMNISRPTFQRVLYSARKKIADALLNGKAIRIEGGNFEILPKRFRCTDGHEWGLTTNSRPEETLQLCPVCSKPAVETPVSAGISGGKRTGSRHRVHRNDR